MGNESTIPQVKILLDTIDMGLSDESVFAIKALPLETRVALLKLHAGTQAHVESQYIHLLFGDI